MRQREPAGKTGNHKPRTQFDSRVRFLTMRTFLNATENIPHAEERRVSREAAAGGSKGRVSKHARLSLLRPPVSSISPFFLPQE
jgi:hypothetical protein